MLNKYKIIWEKWRDPYGLDNEETLSIDKEDGDDNINKQNKVLITPMGMIPYNEYTDCSKIFNFWVGHTNFNLSNRVSLIISEIEGVETLDIFTRYRFRVSFGKAFSDREIMNNINTTINSYLSS